MLTPLNMKRNYIVSILISMACICLSSAASRQQILRISTDRLDLIMEVADDNRLYQIYFGEHLTDTTDMAWIGRPVCKSDNGTLEKRQREVYS